MYLVKFIVIEVIALTLGRFGIGGLGLGSISDSDGLMLDRLSFGSFGRPSLRSRLNCYGRSVCERAQVLMKQKED